MQSARVSAPTGTTNRGCAGGGRSLGSTVAVVGEIPGGAPGAVRRSARPRPRGRQLPLPARAPRRRPRGACCRRRCRWRVRLRRGPGELIRRRRIAAGRFQLLFAPRQWPWRRPGVLVALVSHKFLWLLSPVWHILVLAGTIVLARRDGAWLARAALVSQCGLLRGGRAWRPQSRRPPRPPRHLLRGRTARRPCGRGGAVCWGPTLRSGSR